MEDWSIQPNTPAFHHSIIVAVFDLNLRNLDLTCCYRTRHRARRQYRLHQRQWQRFCQHWNAWRRRFPRPLPRQLSRQSEFHNPPPRSSKAKFRGTMHASVYSSLASPPIRTFSAKRIPIDTGGRKKAYGKSSYCAMLSAIENGTGRPSVALAEKSYSVVD